MNHGSQICRKPNGFYSAERDSLDMICAARDKVDVEISVLFLDDGHVVHVDNSVPDFYKWTFHFNSPFVFTLSNTNPPNVRVDRAAGSLASYPTSASRSGGMGVRFYSEQPTHAAPRSVTTRSHLVPRLLLHSSLLPLPTCLFSFFRLAQPNGVFDCWRMSLQIEICLYM